MKIFYHHSGCEWTMRTVVLRQQLTSEIMTEQLQERRLVTLYSRFSRYICRNGYSGSSCGAAANHQHRKEPLLRGYVALCRVPERIIEQKKNTWLHLKRQNSFSGVSSSIEGKLWLERSGRILKSFT